MEMVRWRLIQIHTGLYRNLPESYDQVLKSVWHFEESNFQMNGGAQKFTLFEIFLF